MDDDNFFAVAPDSGDAPIMLGEAPPGDGGDFYSSMPGEDVAPAASFIGDVNETDNAFAAPSDDDMDAFGSPPDDAFAAPPSEDAPIILGGPPPEVEDGDPEDEPAPVVPAGPSPMQMWNDEWQETLLVRKEEDNAKKAEYLEAARVALENFQKEREMKREAKMAKNREDEQAKLEAIEADLENDNSWQKVCKLVELSHDSTDKAEDVKRMRDALIYLKNDPARAEVLGS
jgi:Clathrin light chain